jgi:hypothetical protein
VLIKTLFVLFVLGMIALLGVGIGVLVRVRRHLKGLGAETPSAPEETTQTETDKQIS